MTIQHVLKKTLQTGILMLLTASLASAGEDGHTCHTPAPKADDAHAHHQTTSISTTAQATPVEDLQIPDVALRDQDGHSVRVHELLQNKVVAMNFVFTTCTTVCPPMGAHFAKLQRQLGKRDDVELISISIDPRTDTPQRLKAWSQKFGAKDGWTLVTGDKLEVDKLLKALGVFTPDFADHAPVILVGDASRDLWTRAYGLAPPAQILELIDQTVDGLGVQNAHHHSDGTSAHHDVSAQEETSR